MLEGPDLKQTVPKITLGQFYFENCIKFSDNICQVIQTNMKINHTIVFKD